MKRVTKKTGVIASGLLGLFIIGTGSVGAAGIEYKNTINIERFVDVLGDSSDRGYCSAAEPQGVVAAPKAVSEAEYRNMINLERFVNALKDPTSHEYRNLMTLERFVAALGEDKANPEYRNIINMERFATALRDSREAEYRNIYDLDRFVANLKDMSEGRDAPTLTCGKPANRMLARKDR